MFGLSLGRMGVVGGLKRKYSPLTLFAASEVGAWYDPSDLSTMFQDRAGTTPVTADGQTVGKILDKSGRGNHATAPTDAARPLYKTDGTYHWLQFDGVDDSLSTAIFAFTGLTGDAFIGVKHVTSTKWVDTWITQQSSGSFWGVGEQSSTFSPTGTSCGSPTYRRNGVDMMAPTRNGIYTTHINQKVVQTTKGVTFGTVSPNSGLSIGGYAGYMLNGNIYSLVVRGALSTTDEITATETWVASKTGVTL